MKKIVTALLIASSTLAVTSTNADVGFGFGATWVFGASSGLAIGPKLFSTDKEDKVAASLGIDYVIGSSSFRPNVGITYLLKDDAFTDLNVGYNLKSKAVDFGFAVGYTETKDDKKSEPTKDPIIPEEEPNGCPDGADLCGGISGGTPGGGISGGVITGGVITGGAV